MIEEVNENVCSKCTHCQVCGFKKLYLSMTKHLNDEFESFMKEEDREFMSFNNPKCKWLGKVFNNLR